MDGGARGNPGPAAAAVCFVYNGREYSWGFFLGEATNNQAEYAGVVLGLTTLKKSIDLTDITEIEVRLDSELVVKQLQGEYRVKDATLQELFQRVQQISKRLPVIKFSHIPREENQQADLIVNQTLDVASDYGTQ